jgi:transposase
MSASAIAHQVRESDSRVWGILNRAVFETRGAADYSGVTRVGIDNTPRRRGQNRASARWQAAPARRVVAVTQGRDKGAQAGSATSSRSTAAAAGHSPSSPATWLKAYSLGVASEMPRAAQIVERFHLMQPFAKATDQVRCEKRRESDEKRRALSGTKCVWPEREGNLTER